ncbi:MAG: tetratricopeptide repeat protein [Bryobacterales bacterium]|nr:tetratricopeptide repeat protein [Bryobacterales bacterium]
MHYSALVARCSLTAISLTACITLVFAQGSRGGGGGNTGSAGSTTAPGGTPGGIPGGSPGSVPGSTSRPPSFPSPNDQRQTPFPTDMQRPIFFSGKVMMEDGTPPPEPVVIERVCNGNPRPEAYTDTKGRFSFQLGQNAAVMADASVSNTSGDVFGPNSPGMGGMGGTRGMGGSTRGGISERDLMGCELRASLAGYRSESVNLGGRRSMDNPDIGVIILRRLANVEGLTFSATSAMAPKDARKAFEKGREQARKKKYPEARKELEKAVTIYPKFANAWQDLGRVLESMDQPAEAKKAYEQALASDGKLVEPYVQLAFLSARENDWKTCAADSEKALKLNPFDFPQAYFYNAVANLNLHNLDAAEKSARDGVKADPQKRIPKMRHVLGIVLAQKNDVSGAMEQMKGYLSMLPENAPDAAVVKGQISQLEKFAQSQNSQSKPPTQPEQQD